MLGVDCWVVGDVIEVLEDDCWVTGDLIGLLEVDCCVVGLEVCSKVIWFSEDPLVV